MLDLSNGYLVLYNATGGNKTQPIQAIPIKNIISIKFSPDLQSIFIGDWSATPTFGLSQYSFPNPYYYPDPNCT
jgi:hypothetical protein